jgi:protein TonB
MKTGTVLLSSGVHLVIAAGIVMFANEKELRKATTVTVVDQKKKEEKPKPPPPKPPPPPPVHHETPKAPAPVPAAAPVPQAAAAPEPAAPINTGLELSNTGPGLEIGTGKATPQEKKPPKPVAPKPTAAKPPPPPPPAAGEECTEPPTKPVPVVKSNPEYTDAARAAGIEGVLKVRIFVGADGAVTKIDVLSSVDAALDAVSLATIQKWRFTPSMRCGKPVDGGVYVFAQKFELVGD